MARRKASATSQTASSPKRTTRSQPKEESGDDVLSPEVYSFEGVVYDTYQEMVNAKRQRNQQMLRESGLLTAKEELAEMQMKRKPAASQGIKKRKVEVTPTERRKSKRIAGIESENIYVENESAGRFTIASDGNTKSTEGDVEEKQNVRQEYYRNRVNDGEDLSIEKAVELTGSKWVQESSVETAIKFVRDELVPLIDRKMANNHVSPKSVRSLGNDEKPDEDWLKTALNELSVDDVDKCAAKVVPDRIYGIAVHPSSDQVIAAAGDKSGYVGIWNVDGASKVNDGVHLFKYHSGAVSCLEWTSSGSKLLSGSYDGTVRVFDVEKESMVQHFATVDESFGKDHLGYNLDTGYSFWTQYACIDSRFMTDQCFFVSTSIGTALHVDLRSKGQVTFNRQWSEKKINTLSLHPNGCSMISGGLDCTVKLWDLRNLSKNRDVPVAEYFGGKSINSAYFSPKGQFVVATTMSDKLDIIKDFHLEKSSSKPTKPWKSIRHDNKTGRWLTTFNARWHPSLDIFCVGSMARPRRIEIFSPETELLRGISGDALTAVASRCCFHPSTDHLIVVGGNSSGRVTVVR
ncbi:hypothetical protein FisN_10Hh090 [Fistulifera solaris]|uniref:WD repeat-containing protein 76 n=1 Tax=Fistulifera solaris TaxID=1519565 RepID=A0A1Z5JXT3_FISSO|nr:hypothetical protein FisN_10Hh090 [Fistulifera solaris]|eukprot:GAX18696.1 hypothetical protein FisN_10Hh090 [Fistulifera solaris]